MAKEAKTKKYQIIYADPPWQYDFAREIKGRPNRNQIIETHYNTMALEDIKKLSVKDIADKNCVLFLWATSPKLKDAMEVLTAWGFDYITSLIWDKMSKGMGYWTRIQHELILVGRKGKVSPPRLQLSSIIQSPRTKHSQKPQIVYDIINKMFPQFSKIELFARNNTPLFTNGDWDVWGNEVESDIEL